MPLWTYRVFRSFGKTRVSSLANVAIWLFDHVIGLTQESCAGKYKHIQLNDLILSSPIMLSVAEKPL